MRNARAIASFFFGLLAVGLLAAGAAVPVFRESVDPLEALLVVPPAVLSALLSMALARRARFEYQRTLGRLGGDGIAAVAQVLSTVALLVSLAAALAVGVFAVLALVLE